MQESKDTRVQGYKVVWSRHPDTPDSPTRKPGAFKGPNGQRYKSPHLQESKVARVQGYKVLRIQGWLGLVPTSRHSRQPDPETRSFQGSKGSKVQESTHARIQGYKGPRIQGCLVPTSRHSRQPDPETRSFQGSKWSKVQESTPTRIQGCQGPRIQGFKDIRLFRVVSDIPTLPTARPGNPELSRVQRFKGTRVHTYKNPRLSWSNDTRVQGYKVG